MRSTTRKINPLPYLIFYWFNDLYAALNGFTLALTCAFLCNCCIYNQKYFMYSWYNCQIFCCILLCDCCRKLHGRNPIIDYTLALSLDVSVFSLYSKCLCLWNCFVAIRWESVQVRVYATTRGQRCVLWLIITVFLPSLVSCDFFYETKYM